MHLQTQHYSYRFAEQVLNSRLALKQEIEDILRDSTINIATLSRPNFNSILCQKFMDKGWGSQPHVFRETDDPAAKLDFFKDRVGIEVQFGHASFIGIDLLKFQVSSYSSLDKIDIGIYITTTENFQKTMKAEFGQNWEGSLNFEKVIKYLPHFKSAIQVPIFVYGIDL
jgi:hypothetical protein